ncbi:MAG TPA: histidine kinase [Streptosporangiaceae bacterium]|nr:histidine kinase [Streptosporangiaceae bacterium]
MLQVVNVAVRAAAIALVGFFTFTAAWPGAGYEAVVIAAFAVAVPLIGSWTMAENSGGRGERYEALLPWGLGIICLICGAAYATPSGGPLLALCFMASLSAGRRLPPTRAWIVPALAVAGAMATGLADHAGIWQAIGYPAVLLPPAAIIGNNIRVHRVDAEHSAQLLAKAEHLREEQAQVATLQERARIAREIHDVLAHSLGALGLQIELVRAVLTDSGDVTRAVELLDQAHRMATSGLGETRQAVHALRGDMLTLPAGLAELTEAHQRRHGAPVNFEVTGEPRQLPPDAGLAITRTAQEALVNTAKHAPRQPVAIRLDYAEDGTSLVVTSQLSAHGKDAKDGKDGGEPALRTVDSGYGLTGLRERLLLLRGTLSAGRRGGDWVVEATVPR